MERNNAVGPDIPPVNFGGPDWAAIENWLAEKLHERYQALAKHDATWEHTLILRGEASFITRMLDLRNTAATFDSRE